MVDQAPEASEQPPDARRPDDAFWHGYLTNGSGPEHTLRRVLRFIPSNPRCKACAAPFSGLGAPVMRMLGKRRSDHNPLLCNSCFQYMKKHRGGAEIECTMLFADVRGSTTLAEHVTPKAFQEQLARFYRAATKVVFANDGAVDKFVGDEVVAMFYPLATGDEHPAKAIRAAQQLLRDTGHESKEGPWLPIGAGVHSGIAWVGAIGDDSYVEMTALGDAVNVAARLASVAQTGEVLVSAATAASAGLPAGGERRTLELKGKTEVVEVLVLH
jgi:adenylate cyclase